MKQLNYLLLLLVCILITLACVKKKKNNSTLSRTVNHSQGAYVIDFDNIEKIDKLNYSDFFKEVETIILETNESSLISSIDGVQVIDNHIYILDKMLSNILVFNIEGKFYIKLEQKEMGRVNIWISQISQLIKKII